MFEDMLQRFKGCVSYENGIVYHRFCEIKSNGNDNAFSFTQKESVSSAVPILVTNLVDKLTIPYEDEQPIGFTIEYVNQDDETRYAKGYIPVYAAANQDFRIEMPATDEFVKEIVSVSQREDSQSFSDISRVLSPREFFNQLNYDISTEQYDWTNANITASVRTIESGALKVVNTISGTPSSTPQIAFYLPDEFDSSVDSINEFGREAEKHAIYMLRDHNKAHKFKARFQIDSGVNMAMVFVFKTPNFQYSMIFSNYASIVTYYQNQKSTCAELVSGGVWLEKEWDFSDMLEEANTDSQVFRYNYLYSLIVYFNPPNGSYTHYIDYLTYIYPRGNIGNKFEILGAAGNIARLMLVKSLMISEVAYWQRVAGMQRFVEMAFRGGLRLLAKDYGLYLSTSYSIAVLRLLARLFSAFVVPAKSVMQESMTTIYNVIDPTGYVEVSAEYSASAYKMIVNVHDSDLEFEELDIEILLLFAERYRPVPADLDVNINFEEGLEELVDVVEEGELETATGGALLGTAATLLPFTLCGVSTSSTALPTDYP